LLAILGRRGSARGLAFRLGSRDFDRRLLYRRGSFRTWQYAQTDDRIFGPDAENAAATCLDNLDLDLISCYLQRRQSRAYCGLNCLAAKFLALT
jgi:hypothetical protein